jgi:short-subunit dehydrogenase
LDQAAEELKSKYRVHVKTIQADLSDPAAVDTVKTETQDFNIGLFIPNAAVENHGDFIDSDLERENLLLQINVISPMQLAHHFGQKMADRGKGGIIFISSTLGYSGVPYFANYAATKAYVLALGEGLYYELKDKGVDVTVLSPGLTDTPMAGGIGIDVEKAPFPLMTPEATAAVGLKALGKRPSVIPGVQNNLMAFLSKHIMTRKANVSMFGSLLKKMLNTEQPQEQALSPSKS